MAEIATIEAISFIFSPEKSTVPIHDGRSCCASRSSFETKFSYPEKITMSSRLAASVRSMSESEARIAVSALMVRACGT